VVDLDSGQNRQTVAKLVMAVDGSGDLPGRETDLPHLQRGVERAQHSAAGGGDDVVDGEGEVGLGVQPIVRLDRAVDTQLHGGPGGEPGAAARLAHPFL
jgi:hypothetical protein